MTEAGPGTGRRAQAQGGGPRHREAGPGELLLTCTRAFLMNYGDDD